METAPPVSVRVSSKGQIAIPKSVRKRLGITRGAEVKRKDTKPAKVYQVVWVAGPDGFAVLLSAEEESAKGRGAAYGCQYRSDYVAAMAGLTFVVLDPLSP